MKQLPSYGRRLNAPIIMSPCNTLTQWNLNTLPRSSLVEGDEQMDRPKCQTSMELCHNFWVFDISTTAYHLGQYSLHLLLLKSSMTLHLGKGWANIIPKCYFPIIIWDH